MASQRTIPLAEAIKREDITELKLLPLHVNYQLVPDGGAIGISGNELGLITEFDVSSVLATLAAEDYVGLRFESDTSNLRVLGLNIKYS